MSKATVLWFTGLSGSGKSTIASAFAACLTKEGSTVKIIDGDEIRKVHKDLTFSAEDIKKNNGLVTQMCKDMAHAYDYIIVSVITPYQESRVRSRQELGEPYNEVYIKASLDAVIKRDVKGLYQKALNKEIHPFIGISPETPYETPQNPDIILDTEVFSQEQCVEQLVDYIQTKVRL